MYFQLRARGLGPGFLANVIRITAPIKGATQTIHDSWLTLLEKLFGGRTMSGRALHVRLNPRDLRLQRLDPLIKLLDRHRVEVLAAKRDERIVGLAREQVFEVHA